MSRDQLKEELLARNREIATLKSDLEKALGRIERLERALGYSERLMTYYTNPNTPPSSESLEWKAQKRERAKKQEKEGKSKRGGRKGHAGASRPHDPERTVSHRFGRRKSGRRRVPVLPECGCGGGGGRMAIGSPRVRDITDIRVTACETRHRVETAVCGSCGRREDAPNDLPRRGNFGKGMVGLVSELRAARVPLKGISVAVRSITGIMLAGSTVNNIMARVGDASGHEAGRILGEVEASDCAGFDETSWRNDGQKVHANVAQSGKNIAINISQSRATLMLDAMDKFDGVAITDGYTGYDRFDKDGMHQSCWAHDLRQTRHLAEKYCAVPPETKRVRRRQQQLHEDHKWVFERAKLLAAQEARSPQLRHTMNRTMQDVLDRYRDAGGGGDDDDMQKVLDKLERHLHRMFAFLEHPGVEPTNNASERALRYLVVFRKISGQTKGGSKAMKRLADFVTCVLTWRAHGKSVAEEVGRLI